MRVILLDFACSNSRIALVIALVAGLAGKKKLHCVRDSIVKGALDILNLLDDRTQEVSLMLCTATLARRWQPRAQLHALATTMNSVGFPHILSILVIVSALY